MANTPDPPNITSPMMQRIFALWDTICAMEATDADRNLRTLLEGIRCLLTAKTALSMIAVRMPGVSERDPADGWRPRHVVHLHPGPKARASTRRAMHYYENGNRDITIINNISHAGTWRAKRLCELAPPEWFKSDFHKEHYMRMDRADAIWVGCPINVDLELYIGIFRGEGQPAFEPRDSDIALFAMRGLGWFLQRYVLSLGLDLARAPLTHTERSVLHGLLNGHAQKIIASDLSQSLYTTQGHIKSIYRKFNVSSRSALTALWLN